MKVFLHWMQEELPKHRYTEFLAEQIDALLVKTVEVLTMCEDADEDVLVSAKEDIQDEFKVIKTLFEQVMDPRHKKAPRRSPSTPDNDAAPVPSSGDIMTFEESASLDTNPIVQRLNTLVDRINNDSQVFEVD